MDFDLESDSDSFPTKSRFYINPNKGSFFKRCKALLKKGMNGWLPETANDAFKKEENITLAMAAILAGNHYALHLIVTNPYRYYHHINDLSFEGKTALDYALASYAFSNDEYISFLRDHGALTSEELSSESAITGAYDRYVAVQRELREMTRGAAGNDNVREVMRLP